MQTLDLHFDQAQAPEVNRLRDELAQLAKSIAAETRAKKPNKFILSKLRQRNEIARDALTDLAIAYVAQIETAEALLRLEHAQALADRYRRDFSDTLWRLDKRAQAGDARASATLGALYRLGVAAERDALKSCGYYTRAADAGHVAAAFQAAECVDAKQAQELRENAAQSGHPLAQEMKGRDCLRDPVDAECALSWLGRAGRQGRGSALSLLGWLYSSGKFVPRDESRAYSYMLAAARLGDTAAQNNLGQMYETGRGVSADAAEAYAWYKRAAEAGLGSAQVNLARAYIEGRGTASDLAAARFWLEQASRQGFAEAKELLQWLAARAARAPE